MTFREMIEQYKAGTLSDEDKILLEAEIEKHEAISDYLFDEAELPVSGGLLSEEESTDTDKQAKEFTASVKASIRRAFIKSGLIIGVIILLIVLAVIFVLPNAVSKAYYDPSEVISTSELGEVTTRLDLDLSVYTELLLPGRYRNTSVADGEGYGEYHITIPQVSSVTGTFTAVSGKITRDELILYDPNLLTTPATNAFTIDAEEYIAFSGTGAAGSRKDAFAALDNLSDNNYYTAYFTLENLTEYESFYNWYLSKDVRAAELWCGVYTGNTSYRHMGFSPELCGRALEWNRKDYPKLCILDSRADAEQMDEDTARSEAMKTHFLSMLRYMDDHSDTAEMFRISNTQWADIIEYVENNEFEIFGFAVVADKENIMKIAEDSAISYVYTTPFN